MFTELLWIIGFYVAAAALAHAAFARSASAGKSHYVLVAGNHQMQIEWYLRSLNRLARRTGKDIGITVVLDNSSDETGMIVEQFVRGSDHIGLVRNGPDSLGPVLEQIYQQFSMRGDDDADQEPVVWVDLNNKEHLSRLPL